ncbi:MAG: hypothetical protein HC924_14555 [Synechococcaceae cyanobacterium SM2_3_2]|nr:hypothetical protein [Synechococcaceae cyanobacterium SM2_3_2]
MNNMDMIDADSTQIGLLGGFGMAGVTTYILALAIWAKRQGYLKKQSDDLEHLMEIGRDIYFVGKDELSPTKPFIEDKIYYFLVKLEKEISIFSFFTGHYTSYLSFCLLDCSNYFFRDLNPSFRQVESVGKELSFTELTSLYRYELPVNDLETNNFMFLFDSGDYRKNDILNSVSMRRFFVELEDTGIHGKGLLFF